MASRFFAMSLLPVLTAVALKLLSAEQLPDLPYMTFLDKYMLSCIFLLVGLVFFSFVVDLIDQNDWLPIVPLVTILPVELLNCFNSNCCAS